MEKIISREARTYSASPFSFNNPAPIQLTPEKEEEVVEVEEQDEEVDNSFEIENQGTDPDYREDFVDDQDEEFPQSPETESLEDPDDSLDESAVAGSLYEAFKSLGFITDEKEVPKGESVTDFLINYEKAKSAKLEEAARANLEATYSKEMLNYVDYLIKGGNPEAVSSFYQLYNLPIEDDYQDSENRKSLILAMYKDKGVSDKRALSLYSTAYDDSEDLDEAKAAKEYFKEKHDAQLAEIQSQEQAKLDAQVQENERVQQSLKTLLKEKKVPGLELNDKSARELENYMFSPTVIVDVKDPISGQTYKGKVSQYYDDYQKFFNNPESLIKLAHFIKAGGQTQTEEEEIQERVSEEILRGLNGFKGVSSSKNSRGPKRKNAFLT
jgi:hypothetical protein